MNQKQIDISPKIFYKDDNETISSPKKIKKVEHERRRKKSFTINSHNNESYIKEIRKKFNVEKGENENDEEEEIDKNTEQSSTIKDKCKLVKNSLTKLSSHSSNNLIKIDDVKNQSDDECKNKSDTECEKMVKKKNCK